MVKNKLVDLIVPFISLIASAVAIILIFNFGVKILKDSGDNLKKERQKIEAEYEELHEDNIDEEENEDSEEEKEEIKEEQEADKAENGPEDEK